MLGQRGRRALPVVWVMVLHRRGGAAVLAAPPAATLGLLLLLRGFPLAWVCPLRRRRIEPRELRRVHHHALPPGAAVRAALAVGLPGGPRGAGDGDEVLRHRLGLSRRGQQHFCHPVGGLCR